MAFKQFDLEEIGAITVYKRRGTRSIRLSVNHDGKVRVSIPSWLPYKAGLSYAESKRGWLHGQLEKHQVPPHSDGQLIGKAHILEFRAQTGATIRSRTTDDRIVITYPPDANIFDTEVQAAAERACLRALRQEAEDVLPGRLHQLAETSGFTYHSVTIRHLKSRWGSCDQDRNIKLNLYLMQLPWHLIDYVLLHELMHTRIMEHGPRFWRAMEALLPDIQTLRKEIRAYKTTILH